MMESHNIEEFLSGTGRDYKNRTFESILKYSNLVLEGKHDYIQCIFPTDIPSEFAPAPVVSVEDAMKMRENDMIQTNLHLATKRMIRFYSSYRGWKRKGDHNHRRISRILRCLRLFGCDKDADYFYEFIFQQKPVVAKETIEYWNHNNQMVI